MRYIALPILVLLITCCCDAQERLYIKDSTKVARLPKQLLALDYKPDIPGDMTVPFKSIQCIDVRLDKSCFGVLWTRAKRVELEPSVPIAFTHHLNSLLKDRFTSNEGDLVAFIKLLRMVQYDSISRVAKPIDVSIKVVAEFECYYRSGELLYPAFRVDTSYIVALEKGDNVTHLLKPISVSFLSKCSKLNIEKVVKRKSYSHNDVTQYYESRSQTAFGDKVPAKGLYFSFEEFRQNKPLITDILIDRKGWFHFAGMREPPFNIGKVFMYSDGRRLWINTPEGFRPLIRNGDRFEYIGFTRRQTNPYRTFSPEINLNSMATAIGTVGVAILGEQFRSGGNFEDGWVHYLDMDTGKIY